MTRIEDPAIWEFDYYMNPVATIMVLSDTAALT
jgi:hypothetical protein